MRCVSARIKTKTEKIASVFIIAIAFIGGIFLTPDFRAQAASATLILQSDFETETVRPTSRPQNDALTVILPSGRPADIDIYYEAGTYADRFAKVIEDPTQAGNKILQYWLKYARVPTSPTGPARQYKGRIQTQIGGHFIGRDTTEVYQRHRMYLHADFALYRSHPEQSAWQPIILELRFGSGPNGDPHVFRITVRIAKEAGVDKPLIFGVGGSKRIGGTPGYGIWENIWGERNTAFQVPTGKWLDVEIGYKQGNAATGRFYFSVQPKGEVSKTVIFDITNWTYHPEAPQPIPVTSWQTFKLYAPDDFVDHIRNNGGIAQIYWDDLEILNGWPSPSHRK